MLSSSSPSAWKTIARSTPSRTSVSAILGTSAASETPSACRRAPAGLQRGPRTLKTVRTPSSRRGTAAKRNDGWKIGANRNPIPAPSMVAATPAGGRSIFTPSASSTSALPHVEEAARLPCLATRAPQAAATMAASVEMLKLPDPSPPVPQVSRSSAGAGTEMGVASSRMVRASPAISSTVSPLTRSATMKPAIWLAVASSRMMSCIACLASDSLRSAPRTSFERYSIIPPPGSFAAAGAPRT